VVDTDHTGEGVGDETSTPTTSKGWVSIQQLAILMERDYRTVRKWVEESCAAQGVPVKISDPVTIRDIAAILREGRERR